MPRARTLVAAVGLLALAACSKPVTADVDPDPEPPPEWTADTQAAAH